MIPIKRAIVLAAAALLALPTLASATPTWLAPEALSAPGQNGEFSDVALAQDGAAAVSWQRADGTNEVVEAAVRPPFGQFGKPVVVSPAANCRFAQVAVDGAGEALVTWINESTGTIEAASVVDGLASTSVKLTPESVSVESLTVAINEGGAAVVAWRRNESSDLVEASYRPAGGSFGKAQALSGKGRLAEFPRVAIDAAGEATVVWSEHSSGSKTFLIEGATQSATTSGFSVAPLSREFEIETEPPMPSVATDAAGDAVVGWVQDGSSKTVSLVERPAGGQFASVQLSEAAANDAYLAVGINGAGDPSVAWDGTDPVAPTVDFASGPKGGPLSNVTPIESQAIFPSLAENAAGDVLVGYATTFAGFGATASYRPTGSSFEAPVIVSPKKDTIRVGGPASQLSVGLDGQGDGLFGYSVLNGSETIVTQSMLDAAGPLLEDLSIPATGAVDSPIGFTVAPHDQLSKLESTSWSFGDAFTAAGTSVTHRFGEPGTYTVSVTSTDALGNSTTQTGRVTIEPAPVKTSKPSRFKGAHLVSHAVRADRHGALRLRVACPASSGCKGRVTLSLQTKARGLGAVLVPVGHDSFRAKAGGRASVTFKLSKPLLKLLRRRHHCRATVLIEAQDVYRQTATTQGRATVRAPKRG